MHDLTLMRPSVCEMMKTRYPSIFFLLLGMSLSPLTSIGQNLKPMKVIPTPAQVAYQRMETIGFIHFSINTFTGKEWGYGDESPMLFNPTALDAEQWVLAAKAGGLNELILTAKHHDGFCLWPSKYTKYSVKSSPYKKGKGDVVREFVDACHKHGVKVGLYLSPWDRNHADYGTPEYIEYYFNQLRELLTQYGTINEMWFDGANGGDGYYGGANETRVIDRETYYPWDSIFNLVKTLQPGIQIFSDAGPDIRWVGNENGWAGETFWSTIDTSRLVIGDSDSKYLNSGDPKGNAWLIGQCDVSIRPGWFYHPEQDTLVKSATDLVDLFYKSVGRNGVLLLNLPPDNRGLIPERDVASLKSFREIIEGTFARNLALQEIASIPGGRDDYRFTTKEVTDGNPDTYWAPFAGTFKADIVVHFPQEVTFDRIMLREPISLGQRISQFVVYALREQDQWEEIASGTTIGDKRLLRIPRTTTSRLKVVFSAEKVEPAISEIGVFLADPSEIVIP